MKPIILGKAGETLVDYAVGKRHDEEHLAKNGRAVGMHECCGGNIDLRVISANFKALACDGCNMRVVIPAKVKTIADLRKYLEHLQP